MVAIYVDLSPDVRWKRAVRSGIGVYFSVGLSIPSAKHQGLSQRYIYQIRHRAAWPREDAKSNRFHLKRTSESQGALPRKICIGQGAIGGRSPFE